MMAFLLNVPRNQRLWICCLSVIVCSALYVRAVIERPLSADLTTVVREGQRQYELIREKSTLPDSGECWKNAVARLHDGCRRLTENLQIELALRFSDCFMQSSGHPKIECLTNSPDGSDITPQTCLRNLTDRVFQVYTEFYTHSQSMCLFLMSQVWHQETQKTIDKLWSSASDVSRRLEEAGKLQETLLDGQKESMNLQQTLLDRSHQLGNLVHDSASALAVVFKEFRSTAAEQQQLLGQVFHHLSALQSWIVGEVSWVDSLVFYVCATFIAYLITSPRRVSDARFPLFVVLLTSAAAERLLASYILAENNDPDSVVLVGILKEQLYWWLWVLRRVSLVISGLIITVIFYKYADQEQQRYQLLLQIWSQNKEMISFLQNKLVNQVVTSSHDIPDSIGYTAIKVGTPLTPKVNVIGSPGTAVNSGTPHRNGTPVHFETPHRNGTPVRGGTPLSSQSPSPRHLFSYIKGTLTPSLESVLSRCPTPPTDLPSNGNVFPEKPITNLTEISRDTTENASIRKTSSDDLRTSSSDDMFHSIVGGSAESSFDSGSFSGKTHALKSRTKSPARRKGKSPGRVPATSVSYNDWVSVGRSSLRGHKSNLLEI